MQVFPLFYVRRIDIGNFMTCSFSKEYSAQSYTEIENVFIYDYLPISNGDSVRVYLYGLFLCQNQNFDVPIEKMAESLKMSVESVIDCFYYWEEFGLVSVISKDPFSVIYLPVHSAYSNKPRKINAEKYTEFTKGIQYLLPTRMISTSEYTEYFSIMETYKISPDAMLMIVNYCVGLKGNDISYRYISKVAKDFGARGIITPEKVEKELSSYVLRSSEIEKILSALSLKRKPEPDDLKLLKKWTNELNFENENIVFAAKSLKHASMEKLDAFIMELYGAKCFSKEEIKSHTEVKQKIFELAIKINKALSIYMEVIDTVIDTYTLKWLSFGFEEEALLYIASICFKSGNNNLPYMDGLIEDLYKKGVIDFSSVSDYFEQEKAVDLFIKKILSCAGVNRRPTAWDRENLKNWKSWNFSDEMILEAARLSSGKSSAIAYINGVLSNWKNNGVFSLENANENSNEPTQEEYNREYERRRAIANLHAQKNYESAMEIQGFSDVYYRLNSIEKDLAYAEINNNTEALNNFEKEKKELTEKAKQLLNSIGLNLDDLSPKYKCEKCKDTGYVGSHKCDCFYK